MVNDQAYPFDSYRGSPYRRPKLRQDGQRYRYAYPLEDFLSTLDKLVDYAVDDKVDAVLICGDVFKNREPDVTSSVNLPNG